MRQQWCYNEFYEELDQLHQQISFDSHRLLCSLGLPTPRLNPVAVSL